VLKAYPLGDWLPDLSGNVLTKAVNAKAIGNGYAPLKGPQGVTVALDAPFNGGGAFIDSTGTSTLIAATSANLEKYTGTAWSVITALSSSQVVRFAQYGDHVLIANGGPVKSYSLTAGTVSNPTNAPNLIDVAQTRDFVMGITTDNALQWCQFNDTSTWTTGANQADKQPSLWGQLKRVVGGEYMIAITDRAVVRGTYVGVEGGLDIIWQFDEISAEVGCMAPGSVCNVGRLVFFLSERGFQMCDGNQVSPIGDEKFDRWFFKTYSRTDIQKIWAAVDPRNSVVMWGMPGGPGKILCYNWVLQRGFTIETDIAGLFTGYTSGVSLDDLDAIYGNLDAIPISLDDPSLAGGNPVLLIADNSNVLNALTGDTLQATFRLEDIEPTPGRRSRIRSLRLVSDTTDASATIDARMRAGDTESVQSASTMRLSGKLPIRANGRYNNLEVTIPAGAAWSFIQGCEIESEAGDNR
jgi:hypothetical protein